MNLSELESHQFLTFAKRRMIHRARKLAHAGVAETHNTRPAHTLAPIVANSPINAQGKSSSRVVIRSATLVLAAIHTLLKSGMLLR